MKKTMVGIVTVLMAVLMTASLFGQAGTGWVEWDDKGRITFSSDDGAFKTNFDVRLYMQAGKFFPEPSMKRLKARDLFINDPADMLSDGTHLRKGRFAVKVKLWDHWRAEWDMDIADETVELKDMWVARRWENSHLKIGHFKVPFGLEILTSSRYISFIERSYTALAFKMGRRTSVAYTQWGENWNATFDLFGQAMIQQDKNKNVDETGGGYAGRFALGLPIAVPIAGNLFLHAGASIADYTPDDDTGRIDFNAEPENKLGDNELVDTDDIIQVERITQLGLEGAVRFHKFSVQGEYAKTNLSRFGEKNNIPYKDASFDGGYIFFSWLVTGEKRPWDNTQGEFGQVIPKNNKLGAWELLLRFSHINLSDEDATDAGHMDGIRGGQSNNMTLGLSWYANPNVKFMANYILTDNNKYALGDGAPPDYDFSAILLQALINF